jgi:hypothetical protein
MTYTERSHVADLIAATWLDLRVVDSLEVFIDWSLIRSGLLQLTRSNWNAHLGDPAQRLPAEVPADITAHRALLTSFALEDLTASTGR